MDVIGLIIGALAAGAAAATKDTASKAVKDAYEGLKFLLGRYFADKPAATQALAQADADPKAATAALQPLLAAAPPATGTPIVVIAEQLKQALAESEPATFAIHFGDKAVGTNIGNHNTISQCFKIS